MSISIVLCAELLLTGYKCFLASAYIKDSRWRNKNLLNFYCLLQVVTVGYIEGGKAANVIPETVNFGGTFRSLSNEGLFYLKQRIKEIIEKQVSVHQCSATVDFMEETPLPYPVTINDEALYEHAKKVSESLVGETKMELFPIIMGAEDFSFFSLKTPAAMFGIGIRNETAKSDKHCIPLTLLLMKKLFLLEQLFMLLLRFHIWKTMRCLTKTQIKIMVWLVMCLWKVSNLPSQTQSLDGPIEVQILEVCSLCENWENIRMD